MKQCYYKLSLKIARQKKRVYLPWLDRSSSLVTDTDLKESLAIRNPSLVSVIICCRSV